MSTSIYITMRDGSIQHAKYNQTYMSSANGPKIDHHGNLTVNDDTKTVAYMPAGAWTAYSNELPASAKPQAASEGETFIDSLRQEMLNIKGFDMDSILKSYYNA